MLETDKLLENLNLENSNLFRLPARSPARRSKGRDFDIRISDLGNTEQGGIRWKIS